VLIRSHGASTIRFLWSNTAYRFWTADHALEYLARFKQDTGAMDAFRRMLAERDWQYQRGPLKDDEVLQLLARLVARGELLVGEEWKTRINAPVSPAEAPSAGAPTQQRSEEQPEGPTYGPGHDPAAQASALQAAAQSGVPFCEECARRQNEGQPV